MFQAQVVEDVVVARVVVVTHRAVQLTLSVEDVNDVARADLIADFGGFEGALVGDDRLFTSLHGFHVGVDRAVQVAGVLHHLTAQAFTQLLALVQTLERLAHLRAGEAAAVKRDIQLQANGALLDVAAVAWRAIAVTETKAVVVTLLVAGHGIQRRRMAGFTLAQGLFGGFNGEVAGLQVEVLRGGGINPGFGVVWRRGEDRQAVLDTFQRGELAVGQGGQGLEGVFNLTLSDDAVRAGGVETSLGFQHVGFIRQTDVEALVGLIQLALERGFFGLGRGQVVLGAQHGEVGFGALQNQGLLAGRELQRSLFVAGFGRLQLEPAVSTEQGLAKVGLIDHAAARGSVGWRVDLGATVAQVGTCGKVGQQASAGLGHHFTQGLVVGARGGEVGVVGGGFLVNRNQVGLGGQRGLFCPGRCVVSGCDG